MQYDVVWCLTISLPWQWCIVHVCGEALVMTLQHSFNMICMVLEIHWCIMTVMTQYDGLWSHSTAGKRPKVQSGWATLRDHLSSNQDNPALVLWWVWKEWTFNIPSYVIWWDIVTSGRQYPLNQSHSQVTPGNETGYFMAAVVEGRQYWRQCPRMIADNTSSSSFIVWFV